MTSSPLPKRNTFVISQIATHIRVPRPPKKLYQASNTTCIMFEIGSPQINLLQIQRNLSVTHVSGLCLTASRSIGRLRRIRKCLGKWLFKQATTCLRKVTLQQATTCLSISGSDSSTGHYMSQYLRKWLFNRPLHVSGSDSSTGHYMSQEVTLQQATTLYNSTIHSYFSYRPLIWMICDQTSYKLIGNVQKRAHLRWK